MAENIIMLLKARRPAQPWRGDIELTSLNDRCDGSPSPLPLSQLKHILTSTSLVNVPFNINPSIQKVQASCYLSWQVDQCTSLPIMTSGAMLSGDSVNKSHPFNSQ